MNERVSKIFSHPAVIPAVVGLVSFGAGAGLGYLLGKRKKIYIHVVPDKQMTLDFDHDEMVQYLEEREDDPSEGKALPDMGKEFVKKFKDIPLVEPEEITTAGELIDKNIFAHDDIEWNYDHEMRFRTKEAPYVLHKDEFYAEEMEPHGYSQTTLTFYLGDEIMTDQDDAPIYNHEQIVGPMLFGHGSGDPKVFYIRNDKMKAEYEILLDQGLYSVEVLGLEIENNERVENFKHSANRKFRMEE